MTMDLRPNTETLVGPADSPSLSPFGEAYEVKFLLPIDTARMVEAWAREYLCPDPYGLAGLYRTTTLYCDTAGLDAFHRSPGYRRSKYRVRRYGEGTTIHLERKSKNGDRVRKKRELMPLEALSSLAGPANGHSWFHRQVRYHALRPVCRIAYNRTAFIGAAPEGGLRLTLDRDAVGVRAEDWDLPPLDEGQSFLAESVILELKFHITLPMLFRRLLTELPPNPARASKYRLCIEALDIARRG
jgi:hypothetical protein